MAIDPAPSQDIRFGRETLVRLGRAIASFATSEVGSRAVGFACVLATLLLVINGLNVVNSYVGRDFMTAIERRDWNGFVWEAGLYLAVFGLLTLAAVFHRFAEERLGLLWREYITRRAVGSYLEGHLYYRLNVSGTLTNPDQRIADDVRTFTTSTLSLTLIFLNGVITIIAFSSVLWSISRLLFVAAVVYAAIGSVLAVLLGRPLVRLNYDQADKEANFRADLIQVRQNTESVALLRREAHLRGRLFARIEALVANLRRIIAVNRNLGFFTTGYNYLIQLIPALIVAPLFIRGNAEFGVISQSAMAFAHVVGAFSLVVNQFPSLSSYAAVLARLGPLAEASEAGAGEQPGSIAIVEDERRLAIEGLTLRSPHSRAMLVRELTVEVAPRELVLAKAESDLVTTALQRAIAGIWETGEGRIVRPPLDDIQFLPERVYLPRGTLRELLADGDVKIPDARIQDALRTTGVASAVERVGGLDVENDWDGLLSVEEQQLICLTHLLIAAPRFAVVVRLGADHSRIAMTRVLAALAAQGTGCLTLGNATLRDEDFDSVIEIAADGSWRRSVKREAVS